MPYCPNCKKPIPEKSKFCPDCGHPPVADPGAPPVFGPGAGTDSKHARTIVLLAVAASFLVVSIILGVLLFLASRDEPPAAGPVTVTRKARTNDQEVKDYRDDLENNWDTLRDITGELVKKDAEVLDQASLNAFSALLTVSVDKTEQIRREMAGLDAPDDYRSEHQDLLDAVGSYRDYLGALLSVTSQDPAAVNSTTFQPVNQLGEEAEGKVRASEEQLPFLGALPDECFQLHTSLNAFYTTIWQRPPQAPAAPAPAPAPAPASASAEKDAIMAMVLGDSAGSWNGADNYEVVSYDPTTNSGIVLITYYLPDTIRYTELFVDKDQYGWYVSSENTYEVPY